MRPSGASRPAPLLDRLGLRFAFGALGLSILLFFALLGAWGWIPALAATEWTARFLLRRRYGADGEAASRIRNKWHYTAVGNSKRARIVASHLREFVSNRPLPSDAALRA